MVATDIYTPPAPHLSTVQKANGHILKDDINYFHPPRILSSWGPGPRTTGCRFCKKKSLWSEMKQRESVPLPLQSLKQKNWQIFLLSLHKIFHFISTSTSRLFRFRFFCCCTLMRNMRKIPFFRFTSTLVIFASKPKNPIALHKKNNHLILHHVYHLAFK